jgi:hypothetical protein
MKIAVLAESPADRRAIEVLTCGILDESTQFEVIQPRAGGFHAVLSALGPALKNLHYCRTADGLIVVVDADNSPVELDHPEGRMSVVLTAVRQTQDGLAEMPGYDPIKVAVGVAVPSLEAWLLSRDNHECTEAAWVVRKNAGTLSATEILDLKNQLYGTDRPDLVLETTRMVEMCDAVIPEGGLDVLAQAFPYGFGPLLNELRAW